MNQEISYSGFSAVPSDYVCQDGALAVAVNVLPEDGALQPLAEPSTALPAQLWHLDETTQRYVEMPALKCVYMHITAEYRHFIAQQEDGTYCWLEKTRTLPGADGKPRTVVTTGTLGRIDGFTGVSSVGNTLVFLTADGMRYFLWKSAEGKYLSLGAKLPECPISFGLLCKVEKGETFDISFDSISEGDLFREFSDSNKNRVTEQVLAKVNRFIAEKSTDKGRFIFPFLVRYAYRLYDGTLTMHSSPVLMVASTECTPSVFWKRISGEGSYTSATLQVVAPVHRLDYAVTAQQCIERLEDWQDIVRSVDIFISKPIYTYDQSGKCERFANTDDYKAYAVCKNTSIAEAVQKLKDETWDDVEKRREEYRTKYPARYQKATFSDLYVATWGIGCNDFTYPISRVILPGKSADKVKEDIRNTSQFYLLDSIKVGDLKTERTAISVKEDYLQSLVTRETMTDDYDSHDTLIPGYAFPYNARLNLANMKKRLYDEYSAGAMVCHTDGYVSFLQNDKDNPTWHDGTAEAQIYYFIRQDGREIVVSGERYPVASTAGAAPFIFLFYPNVNAYKAVVTVGGRVTYEVRLEQHAFLNGAFYFNGWDNPVSGGGGAFPSWSKPAERTVGIQNKVYTSEVNNPFFFPLLGINTVGTGEIMGVCAAAKALSEGQFGQFPLYAFSSDGVWALEVSSTGTYSARQPVTRDVCINADGITQLDSAVLFPTDRGIMLIAGSQTVCISEAINSEYPFDATQLPGFTGLHAMLGHEPSTDTCLPTMPFTKFLRQCRMLYDYVHQRVIVYAPGVTYAYVYSLKSQQWGMIFSTVASHLNSYPEALAVDNSNAVLNFSAPKADAARCLYVTRPLKLGAPDVLKTVGCAIQRGFFRRGNVATALYGSRDLLGWHLVWSSKDHCLRGFGGSPYKYFRIAGVATLAPGESVSGVSVQFRPRYTDRLR